MARKEFFASPLGDGSWASNSLEWKWKRRYSTPAAPPDPGRITCVKWERTEDGMLVAIVWSNAKLPTKDIELLKECGAETIVAHHSIGTIELPIDS